jgi:FPC/CPF motif-containing protein YcgG
LTAGRSFGLKELMTQRHQQDDVGSVTVFAFKFPEDLFPEEPDMQDCFDFHPVELTEDDLEGRQS